MRAALDDERLLGNVLRGESWRTWKVFLIAMMGEGLLRTERWLFEQFTGRAIEPGERVDECLCVVGRRGGKDKAAATLAVYIAALNEHPELSAGERGLVLLLAPDQRQSAVTLNYIEAALDQSEMLRPLVVNRTADQIELSNGIDIEVRSANFRRIRGVTAVCIIGTESAFWMDNETGSANADAEILAAARPMLATTQGPMILISSPYARRGETWSIYKKNFGPNGDPRVLVIQGSSKDFNSTLPDRVINRAYERDPIAAAAEFGGLFRSDIEAFIAREVVERAVSPGVRERAPVDDISYTGFVDPSGGANDGYGLAISHMEGERAVLDAVRLTFPPFSPESVTAEYAALLKSYRAFEVHGDRYAGEWPREQFGKRGVAYQVSAKTKSELYLELLAPLNSGQVELLDNDRLVNELTSLERRTARSGRDTIDHPPGPGAHDDLSNSVAGALYAARASEQWDQGIPVAPRIFTDRREPIWGDTL